VKRRKSQKHSTEQPVQWLSRGFVSVSEPDGFLNEKVDLCAAGGVGFLEKPPWFEVMNGD
jgi:hypothetical protein